MQEKAIAQIAIDGSAEYVDVQDGKVLKLYGTKPEHIAADYFGYMMDGYEITVTDAKTNELLYRGKTENRSLRIIMESFMQSISGREKSR